MSYFQLACAEEGVTYADIEECLAQIESAGVQITEVERFPATSSLIGCNVFIQDVPDREERRWQKVITKVVQDWPNRLCHRFRFKGYSY